MEDPVIVNVCFNGSACALRRLPLGEMLLKYIPFFPNSLTNPYRHPVFNPHLLVYPIGFLSALFLIHGMFIIGRKWIISTRYRKNPV